MIHSPIRILICKQSYKATSQQNLPVSELEYMSEQVRRVAENS